MSSTAGNGCRPFVPVRCPARSCATSTNTAPGTCAVSYCDRPHVSSVRLYRQSAMSQEGSTRCSASTSDEISVVCMAFALHEQCAEILHEPIHRDGGNGSASCAQQRMHRHAPWEAHC